MRTPSGVMRLSEMPETDVGEAAARAVTGGEQAPPTEAKPNLNVETPAAPQAHVTLPAISGGAGVKRPAPSDEPPLSRSPKPSGPSPAPAPAAPAPSVASPGAAALFSFGALFPPAERGVVQVVESALALGDPAAAVTAIDQLVARALASGATLSGSAHDAPRDPALVALLLGVEPRRYLKFRSLVREARAGTLISVEAGLFAYAFVLDLRRALRDAG
jgi:hypothetical protein